MAGIVNEAYTLKGNVQQGGSPLASANVVARNDPDSVVLDKTTDAQGDITDTILIAKQHSITLTSTRATTDFNPFELRVLKWLSKILSVSVELAAPTQQTLFASDNTGLITETVQATVQAYTGLTFNHPGASVTTDGSGITPVDTRDEFYDACQDEAIVNDQGSPAEILETPAGRTDTLAYDRIVDGHIFDLQATTLAMAAGKTVTIQGAGGNLTNGSVIGDAALGALADMTTITGLNISGDMDLSLGGTPRTITLSGCNWGSVSASTPGWTLQRTGGSTIGVNNDPGNITVTAPVALTISASVSLVGAEVRIYDLDGVPPGSLGTELDGVESHTTPTFLYAGSGGNDIWVQILQAGFVEFGQQVTMPASDGAFFAQLVAETNA